MTPSGNIDYIVMTNANEESPLWELLLEYKQEYPGLSDSEALSQLMQRISELVSERKVGIYRADVGRQYDSPKEYQDLSINDALAVIKEKRNWQIPEMAITVLHYLYAQDKNYFGEYYGESKQLKANNRVE